MWPAELKPHAEYLYSNRRAEALVEAARAGGWLIRPNLQIAFFRSPAPQRLYLEPEVDLDRYVRLWEGAGAEKIGAYSADEVLLSLCPWLKEQGYATPRSDDGVLNDFLRILSRRDAHLRAGLRLDRRWARDDVSQLSLRDLAISVRQAINQVLGSIGEPPILAP